MECIGEDYIGELGLPGLGQESEAWAPVLKVLYNGVTMSS